jgi:hypothetical protein
MTHVCGQQQFSNLKSDIFALINSSSLHETGGIKIALAYELKRL